MLHFNYPDAERGNLYCLRKQTIYTRDIAHKPVIPPSPEKDSASGMTATTQNPADGFIIPAL